ncbi:MAG: hypothetical protein MUO63_07860 [Desulfobulbaceae bacterium]|nr:hypothetical protein [Desulfobulbaceae bacterium]
MQEDTEPLGPDDYVISADEKRSIQARDRSGLNTAPRPRRCRRKSLNMNGGGPLAFIAAWDVRKAKVFGLCESTTGIDAYKKLAELVMQQEPYRSARGVFLDH